VHLKVLTRSYLGKQQLTKQNNPFLFQNPQFLSHFLDNSELEVHWISALQTGKITESQRASPQTPQIHLCTEREHFARVWGVNTPPSRSALALIGCLEEVTPSPWAFISFPEGNGDKDKTYLIAASHLLSFTSFQMFCLNYKSKDSKYLILFARRGEIFTETFFYYLNKSTLDNSLGGGQLL
jgi:hypothetical protein